MGLREGAGQEYDEAVTEHSIVEDFRDGARSSVASIRCRKCGSSSTVRYRTGPPIGRDELSRLAWERFLLNVFWDCDEALVARLMSL